MSSPLQVIAEVRRLKAMRRKLLAERKAKPLPGLQRKLTTEYLLTEVFGISTATPVQRATARILDGLPLGDLAADTDVQEFVGGPEVIEAIAGGKFFQEVVLLAAIRGAKTFIACAAAIRMTQTVDVTGLRPGEVPRVPIVSISLNRAKTAFTYLRAAFVDGPLRSLLVGQPTANSLTVRGPNDWPVEIACVAGARAGGDLVGSWLAGVIFDEAPRMAGKDDGVVNLDDARSAILGRLLPGAQSLYVGSPWAPFGTVYNLVEEFAGKPSKSLIVLRGTGPMLNPFWWTAERCEELRVTDPVAYQTDVLGLFANPESGLLDPMTVSAATRDGPEELPPDKFGLYGAGVDPSEGTTNGNGWTLVIVERVATDDDTTKFRVAYTNDFRGARPSEIWADVAKACKRYNISEVASDQYAASANADLAEAAGLQLKVETATGPKNLEAYTDLATMMRQGLIELSPNPTLRADLLNVRKKVTQQTQSIYLPKTADGRHCDFAPALVKALRAAQDPGLEMLEAMRARIRRRQNGKR